MIHHKLVLIRFNSMFIAKNLFANIQSQLKPIIIRELPLKNILGLICQ